MDIDGVEWLTRSPRDGMWTGRIRLPSFAACQPRYYVICTFPGPVIVGREHPDGEPAAGPEPWLPLEVETPEGEPSAAQYRALRELAEGEAAAFRSVMGQISTTLFDYYLSGRELEFTQYRADAAPAAWEFPGGAGAFLGWLRTPAGISQTLTPLLVEVGTGEREGRVVASIRFRCLFESEHGMLAALVGAQCLEAGSEVDLGE